MEHFLLWLWSGAGVCDLVRCRGGDLDLTLDLDLDLDRDLGLALGGLGDLVHDRLRSRECV